ncbi:MAG: DUF1576 domain-containing protein [Clostridiales bacterium]|nr:DUF1576 domain-containing protein [Clostridiales bacterium]
MESSKTENFGRPAAGMPGESVMIELIASAITVFLFAAAVLAAFYMKEWGNVFRDWIKIMTGPNPLVTDYYSVGGLSAAFLNAAVCGLVCILFMVGLKGETRPNALAGYFLVIAHCFYGLNLLNMIPCFLAPMMYMKLKKLSINDNLHVCMFATCFGPFISEFLFRYTLGESFVQGEVKVTMLGVLLAVLFSAVIGFVIPAILPGARAWHKGFNLFNGGLAFGIFGFFAFNLFYTTFGIKAPEVLIYYNPVYDSFSHSYTLFVNGFFLVMFLFFFAAGYFLNGKSLKGYEKLLNDSGHMSNFVERYSIPVCMINMGLYGVFFLGYVNLVMLISEGAGFTGPTTGVIFASMTFVMLGQHPKNVWPILAGFLLLYLANVNLRFFFGLDPGWTISGQTYINSAAFATGICPIVGRYGKKAGMAAGVIDAALCTATGRLHGGLVLYNGGFTAGLTVLILLPVLEHYMKENKAGKHPDSMDNFIVIEEPKKHMVWKRRS